MIWCVQHARSVQRLWVYLSFSRSCVRICACLWWLTHFYLNEKNLCNFDRMQFCPKIFCYIITFEPRFRPGNLQRRSRALLHCATLHVIFDKIVVKHQVTIIKPRGKKWRKCISVTGSLRGQAQVRPIDKLHETCTNADDRMMLVQHCSGDRVMS